MSRTPSSSHHRWSRVPDPITLGALLAVLLAGALLVPGEISAATRPSRATARTASPSSGLREWTLMVYMAGDNNLETSGDDDINEMEVVGSCDRVALVVQFDRIGNPARDRQSTTGWSGARRFYVQKDDDRKKISSPMVGDLGNVDMADEESLLDFVRWAHQQYPARRYALIFWNHGTGWKEIMPSIDTMGAPGMALEPGSPSGSGQPDPDFDSIALSISYDDTSGTAMNIPTLGKTLQKVKQILGQPVELLGFDACLMQMIEVAYECAPAAKWQVGAAEREPETGWAYDAMLAALQKKPTMDGRELGQVIAATYHEAGKSAASAATEGGGNSTISLLDLAKLPPLIEAINRLSDAMLATPADLELIAAIREQTMKYYYRDYIDLDHFCALYRGKTRSEAVRTACDQVRRVLDWRQSGTGVIAVNLHRGALFKNSSGVSLYFPDRMAYKNFQRRYALLAMSARERWRTFLDGFASPDVPYVQVLNVELTDENRDGRFTPGEAVDAVVVVENLGRKPASGAELRFAARRAMVTPTQHVQPLTQALPAGKKSRLPAVRFTINENAPLDTEIPLVFTLSGAGPVVASHTVSFYVKSGFSSTNQALLVITDAFTPSAQVLQTLLRDAGIKFDLWDRMLDGDVKLDVLNRYAKGWVLLSVQNSSDQHKLNDDEIKAIDGFLTHGGRLLLSGQDLGFNLRETDLLSKRIKVRFVQDDTNIHVVKGSAKFMPGTVMQIHGGDGANNQKWPDEIDAMPGADAILTYSAEARDIADEGAMNGADFKPGSRSRGIKSSGGAAVQVADGYRLVFFCFGFEAISEAAQRLAVLKNCLSFLFPDLPTEVAAYRRAVQGRRRGGTGSGRDTDPTLDGAAVLFENLRDHAVSRARLALDGSDGATQVERAVQQLQGHPDTANSELSRRLQTLLEFRRQHGN